MVSNSSFLKVDKTSKIKSLDNFQLPGMTSWVTGKGTTKQSFIILQLFLCKLKYLLYKKARHALHWVSFLYFLCFCSPWNTGWCFFQASPSLYRRIPSLRIFWNSMILRCFFIPNASLTLWTSLCRVWTTFLTFYGNKYIFKEASGQASCPTN